MLRLTAVAMIGFAVARAKQFIIETEDGDGAEYAAAEAPRRMNPLEYYGEYGGDWEDTGCSTTTNTGKRRRSPCNQVPK